MGLDGRRAIIIHEDDLGSTHGANQAYFDLGLPTGSVMMPCTWAKQLVGVPGDIGLHCTLNSEWSHLRWRPLTTGASLVDGEGYFHATVEAAWAHIRPEEAEAELRAQINADTHMGAILRPDIAERYIRLALEFGVPAMLPDDIDWIWLPDESKAALGQLLAQTPLPKVRVLDGYNADRAQRAQFYVELLSQQGPGVYHFLHHASPDTPEIRTLPDWPTRVADYHALQDPSLRRVIDEFTVITYADVRAGLRRFG
jgi:hypothetical protein